MSSVFNNKLGYEVINNLCDMCNTYKEVDWWSQSGKINLKEGCISYTKYIGGELLIELHTDRTRKHKLFGKRYDTSLGLSASKIYADIYTATGIIIANE